MFRIRKLGVILGTVITVCGGLAVPSAAAAPQPLAAHPVAAVKVAASADTAVRVAVDVAASVGPVVAAVSV